MSFTDCRTAIESMEREYLETASDFYGRIDEDELDTGDGDRDRAAARAHAASSAPGEGNAGGPVARAPEPCYTDVAREKGGPGCPKPFRSKARTTTST